MNKIDEIKLALLASKLGPMYKADFDANAHEYIAYLLEENERLRKQLDGTADVIKVKENALTQLKDANDELATFISQQAMELEEARKIEFPRQMEGRGGWKIDYNFIEQIQQEVEHAFAHDVSSFEQIEAVLLAIENLAAGQEGEGNQ
ncbi:hypothetical protein [Paenibacillus sp. 7516]|uniref:hypothetical protein n=1 Tax=Paenibacillus sp. 7516 TaxID=2022549 RepID=UPI000BA753D5|nr:hypothetical protein [Paenibacillus sp. 7516]PAF31887.1 hypothetical protein CHI14_09550 [Paenibacillus sp. 7516]